jgi:hypothetical protein
MKLQEEEVAKQAAWRCKKKLQEQEARSCKKEMLQEQEVEAQSAKREDTREV